MIYEDQPYLTYAQSKRKFQKLLEMSLEEGAADAAPPTGFGISFAVDYACYEVAVASRDGGDVQAAIDKAWVAFHDFFPKGS